MGTVTKVFAQINSLFPDVDDVLNPVELALAIEALGGDFGKPLLEELAPRALAAKSLRIAANVSKNDPEIHPYGLPTITSYEGKVFEALPIFWLRNQNIDINSCWWNIFTETGAGYNNNPTSYNDDYWLRDLNDPDINRIPEDDHILLSQRLGRISVEEAVPYELVYPEWFTAHPEYVKTDKLVQQLGMDISTLLAPYREGSNAKDIDHILLGYFLPLLPLSDGMAEYTFRFFKELLKDTAFNSPLQKRTSVCTQYALDINGFYNNDGNNKPFLNTEGTTLTEIKNNNYYYEYSTGARNAFTKFVDPRRQMSLELDVDNVIVRKVKGRLPNSYHNKVSVTVGKSSTFPEFTAYADVLYPTNPNQTSFPFTAQELENYDIHVSAKYQEGFTEYSAEFEGVEISEDPIAYISFRRQKVFKDNVKGFEDWDFETATDLNSRNAAEYYEEIIIVNPRAQYRGIYGADFRSGLANDIFHNGSDDENTYWQTLDKNSIFRFAFNSNKYTKSTNGTRFTGDFESTDPLVFPVIYPIVSRLYLKDREEVIARALSVLSIAIVRKKVSRWKKALKIIIIIFVVAFIIYPGVKEFATTAIKKYGEGKLLSYLAGEYIKFKAYEKVSDEVVKLLVDEFGIDIAGKIIAAITVWSTYKVFKDPSLLTGDDFMEDMLKITANLDDSYARIINSELKDLANREERLQTEYKASVKEIQSIESMLVDPNPNFTYEMMVYNLVDETPSEFYNRTIENKNPGVELFDYAKDWIGQYKRLVHNEFPPIHDGEGISEEDYLDQLIG